jgi:putative lipase involved disintegration of autophagic bodies
MDVVSQFACDKSDAQGDELRRADLNEVALLSTTTSHFCDQLLFVNCKHFSYIVTTISDCDSNVAEIRDTRCQEYAAQ